MARSSRNFAGLGHAMLCPGCVSRPVPTEKAIDFKSALGRSTCFVSPIRPLTYIEHLTSHSPLLIMSMAPLVSFHTRIRCIAFAPRAHVSAAARLRPGTISPPVRYDYLQCCSELLGTMCEPGSRRKSGLAGIGWRHLLRCTSNHVGSVNAWPFLIDKMGLDSLDLGGTDERPLELREVQACEITGGTRRTVQASWSWR
jgi:hypothetical protein